jgi:uncharacterized membrane protein YhaH (DUF805 family)
MGMMMQAWQGEWTIWHWVMLGSILARLVATGLGIMTGIRQGPVTRQGFTQMALPALFFALGLPWLAMLFHSMSFVIVLQIVLPILHYIIVHIAARRLVAVRLSPHFCWVSMIPYATVVIVIVLSMLQVQVKQPGEGKSAGDMGGPVQR